MLVFKIEWLNLREEVFENVNVIKPLSPKSSQHQMFYQRFINQIEEHYQIMNFMYRVFSLDESM